MIRRATMIQQAYDPRRKKPTIHMDPKPPTIAPLTPTGATVHTEPRTPTIGPPKPKKRTPRGRL